MAGHCPPFILFPIDFFGLWVNNPVIPLRHRYLKPYPFARFTGLTYDDACDIKNFPGKG